MAQADARELEEAVALLGQALDRLVSLGERLHSEGREIPAAMLGGLLIAPSAVGDTLREEFPSVLQRY